MIIHIEAGEADEITARLCDHDETITLETGAGDLRIFMTPSQARELFEALRESLMHVVLEEEGATKEGEVIFIKIRGFRGDIEETV